ncbi:MAG: hypothetical protein HC821_03865 [Lewinella sp.]|nr:hypothetical protein [Lewinella sp.]
MNLAELLSQPDPVRVARQLLGLTIYSCIAGVEAELRITETEAYWAPQDQASHARNHRRTPRTEVFYQPAGTAYVYLCYGIHWMLNVVTGAAEDPHARSAAGCRPHSGAASPTRAARAGRRQTTIKRGPGRFSPGPRREPGSQWLLPPGPQQPSSAAGD